MESKSEILTIRFTPSDFKRLTWAAERLNLPVATYVRHSLQAVVRRELSEESAEEVGV